MKILPYQNLTYKTHLSKEEVLKRLKRVTEPKKMIRWNGIFANKNHLDYEGIIQENTFKINRIIDNRNSFLPQIEGKIEEINHENTKIVLVHIKMRLHIFVLIFMGIWLSVVGFVCVALLNSWIFNEGHQQFNIAIFIPFFMFLFGLLLPTLAFHYEGNKSKEFFEKLFEAERQIKP